MTPFKWKQSLLLWLSLPYALGVYTRFSDSAISTLVLVSALFIGVLLYLQYRTFPRPTTWYIGLTALLFFGLGWMNLHQTESKQDLNPTSPVLLIISSEVNVQNNGYRTYAKAYQGGQHFFIYLNASESEGIQPTYGDSIWISEFEPVQFPSPVPGAFDFKNYLRNKGVFHSVRFNSAHVIKTSTLRHWTPISFAIQLKNQVLCSIDSLHISLRSKAIVSGLLVGDKSLMNSAIRTAFTASGVMHIFAVSGLHVGIIYASLLSLLRFIRLHVGVQVVVILLGIWMFAMVTGLHASVCRAGIMVSIVELSRLFGRKYFGTNALGLAAICILTLDPYALFQLGFQLSFLAMLGIYTIGQPLNALLQNQTTIIRKVGGLMSISIGAQVGVAPLLIYHFHSFPALFLISNLLIVPFIPTIIGLTSVALLTVYLYSHTFLERAIEGLLDLIVFMVEWITQMGSAYIEHIPMSKWTLVICYAIILLAVYRLQALDIRVNVFRWMAYLVAVGAIANSANQYQWHTSSDLILYNEFRDTRYAIRSGKDLYWLTTNSELSVPTSIDQFTTRNKINLTMVMSGTFGTIDSVLLQPGMKIIALKKPDGRPSGFKSFTEFVY